MKSLKNNLSITVFNWPMADLLQPCLQYAIGNDTVVVTASHIQVIIGTQIKQIRKMNLPPLFENKPTWHRPLCYKRRNTDEIDSVKKRRL